MEMAVQESCFSFYWTSAKGSDWPNVILCTIDKTRTRVQVSPLHHSPFQDNSPFSIRLRAEGWRLGCTQTFGSVGTGQTRSLNESAELSKWAQAAFQSPQPSAGCSQAGTMEQGSVVPGGQGLDLSGLPLREVTGATDLLRVPWSCGCLSLLFSEGAIKS